MRESKRESVNVRESLIEKDELNFEDFEKNRKINFIHLI